MFIIFTNLNLRWNENSNIKNVFIIIVLKTMFSYIIDYIILSNLIVIIGIFQYDINVYYYFLI